MHQQVKGFVRPGFEPVRRVFAENLADRDEVGAAFAVNLDGECVVDLWGGTADGPGGRPWQHDTVVGIFSGSKALCALCVLKLLDDGRLRLDAPVADYWPEFAAAGKHRITVAEAVSHRARLPGFAEPLREDDMRFPKELGRRLARQPPDPDERARYAYHPVTFGVLCGELVRRVDGRTVGRYFDDEFAVPLGLDIWIGLPARIEDRVATLAYGPGWGNSLQSTPSCWASDPLLARIWANPVHFPSGRLPWNRTAFHRAEIPAANAIASARSVAKLMAMVARGGEIDGNRILSRETVELASRELSRRWDEVHGEAEAFGVGFQLQNELGVFGPPPDAFGHGGAGGSIQAVWPSLSAGVSYAMNALRDDQAVDPRAHALLKAAYDSARDCRG